MAAHNPPKLAGLLGIFEHMSKLAPSGNGHQTFKDIWASVGELATAGDALHKLSQTRNPSDTDASHFKRVNSAAERYLRQVDAVEAQAKASIQRGRADLEGRMTAKLNLKANAYAAEVRAVFRALSPGDKLKMLGELAESTERGPELAAIFHAPQMTTGLSRQHRDQFMGVYANKHAAEEIAERELMEEAFSNAETSARAARDLAAGYTDPARLADITQREHAAVEASKKFDATVRA